MEPQQAPQAAAADFPGADLYAQALQKNSAYYLKRFARFAAGGKPLSWNTAACFFTFGWLRYRRMFALSWLYLAVSTPALLGYIMLRAGGDACAQALDETGQTLVRGMYILLLAGFIVPPLFANRLYFGHLRKLIANGKAGVAERTSPAFPDKAAGTGSFVAGFIPVLAVLALAVIIPGYANYSTRARVSELVMAGSSYKTAISYLYQDQRRMPTAAEVAKEVASAGGTPAGGAKSITVDANGRIKIVADIAPLHDRSVIHTPTLTGGTGDSHLTWRCSSPDIPNICLPASCRSGAD